MMASVELLVGDRVRVMSRRRGPQWVRRGVVMKISLQALVAFIRFDEYDGGEWIEFERIEVINHGT